MVARDSIVYEPDEPCPPLVSLAVGFQGAMFILVQTPLLVSIALLGDAYGERYLAWAIFTALIINGAFTAVQSGVIGRFGSGHLFFTGTVPVYLAVCRIALAQGGPALLSSLIIVSSLFQFLLAAWLPLLRRIVTPTVSGTVLILVAAITIPIAFEGVADVPEGSPAAGGVAAAGATLAVTTVLGLRATGRLRLWSPFIGIAAGCAVAAGLGMYDVQGVVDAPWVGVPSGGWPGVELTPGVEFWALLPMFLVVSLVSAIKAIGGGIALQQVSWRGERATDFRRVQGAVNANGAGSLLSGIAGTPPAGAYEGATVSIVSFTGVAARNVGYATGAILIALAFLPKVSAFLLAIPNPVIGIFVMIVMGLLLVEGMRTVFQDGIDYRKALVVAVSLSVGMGLESQDVFSDLVGGVWGALLGNGLAGGTVAAILMTAFLELSSTRRLRLETELDMSALPRIDEFLQRIAGRAGWDEASADRLRFVGEEALSSLLQEGGDNSDDGPRRLTIVARPAATTVELEFLASLSDENLEDRLAYMNQQSEIPEEREISFRLLRHYASSVRHRKYHGLDIVTVQVEGSR